MQAAELEKSSALARGSVFFVPAGTSLRLTADAGAGEPLLVWSCAVSSRVYAAAGMAAAEQPAQLVGAA